MMPIYMKISGGRPPMYRTFERLFQTPIQARVYLETMGVTPSTQTGRHFRRMDADWLLSHSVEDIFRRDALPSTELDDWVSDRLRSQLVPDRLASIQDLARKLALPYRVCRAALREKTQIDDVFGLKLDARQALRAERAIIAYAAKHGHRYQKREIHK